MNLFEVIIVDMISNIYVCTYTYAYSATMSSSYVSYVMYDTWLRYSIYRVLAFRTRLLNPFIQNLIDEESDDQTTQNKTSKFLKLRSTSGVVAVVSAHNKRKEEEETNGLLHPPISQFD